MEKEEKARRFRAARRLLLLIKQFGGTARLAAAVLGISPSTASHWFSARPVDIQRVGAPTDAQLRMLTVVLYLQFNNRIDNLMALIGSRWIRPAEQLLLLRLLTPHFAWLSAEWQLLLKDYQENLEYGLRKYAKVLREEKRQPEERQLEDKRLWKDKRQRKDKQRSGEEPQDLEQRQAKALVDFWGFEKDAISAEVLGETSDEQLQEFITTLIGSDSQLGSLVDEVDEAMRVVIEGDLAKKGIIITRAEEPVNGGPVELGGDDDRKKTKPVDPE